MTALAAFVIAAGLLTITPGLDTMLVVRTRLASGRTAAFAAAAGIGLGCLAWGVAVAIGLGAVLAAAPLAYAVLRWCGALYLLGSGVLLILRPRRSLDLGAADAFAAGPAWQFLLRGLLTNLLNPKVGLFYLSFLPQFVPAGTPAGIFMVMLTLVHVVLGLLWSAVLIASMGVVRRLVLRNAILPWLDRATGGVFVAFGLKLALDRA